TSSSEINQSLQEDLNIAGDIIFRPNRKREIDRGEPWEGGIIPFVFAHEEALICDAMYHFYEVSNGCVEFVERTNETSFLVIRRHDVCAATVGQERMFNTLRMNSECMDNFTLLHELYHVLGFEHEQCRSDRDKYVTILTENIRPDVVLNFDIIPDDDVLKVPYDYESIMHYPENAYSKNGNLTIITKVRTIKSFSIFLIIKSEINHSLQEDLNIAGDIIFCPNRKSETDRGEPWEGGIIPFVFMRGAFEADEEALICDTMNHLYEVANGCVEFVERTNETSYLIIRSDDFCAATVGQEKMFNTLAMNSECMDNATVLHELYHDLGFKHEHCRSDRDKYVTILNKNIRSDVLLNFDIIPDDVLKVPYDYESIVHYPENAYSKNGNLTIITNVRTIKHYILRYQKDNKYQKIIGTSEVLSERDILKIKKKYDCE
ncbi:Zinc metalloproteinase nas-7, partial [Armadillidium vulgare]